MTKNTQSTTPSSPKTNKPEAKSASRLRFLYVLTLVAMVLSLFLRVSGVRPSSARQTTSGTAARVLVFHQEEASSCEDLTVTAAWNAVFSSCGGAEKQSTLSSAERLQLQKWIDTYGPVSYDHQAQTANVKTQLSLNGRGSQQADDGETQQMIAFAKTLATRLAAQP